jgi:hypothetical protein
MERRLALWSNSSLGLLSLVMRRQDTRGPLVKFPKAWWESTDVLDLASLDDEQFVQLTELWHEISDEELK